MQPATGARDATLAPDRADEPKMANVEQARIMRGSHRFHENYELACTRRASDRLGMDLFMMPMACSLAAHIAAREAGVELTLHRVTRATKRLDDGRDYKTIAPQETVPAIRLLDGTTLTETSAVLQYIADQAPERRLAPPWGTLERYRLAEWLNFTTSELHKKLAYMIFSTKTTDEMKRWTRANAGPTLDHVARHLDGREFLLDHYTVADCYMFWALFALPYGGVSLEAHPGLRAYVARIQARPAVAAAFAIEAPLYRQENPVQGSA